MAALQAQSRCSLRHVPAIFLEFAQNEFAFIRAARFVQRGIGMLRTLGDAAKQLRRKMVRFDARLWADNHQALDQIAQLTHVAGPRVAQQNVHRRVAEFTCLLAIRRTKFSKKMSRENGYVFGAVAERRHEKRNDVEPVKQVLTKGAAGDFLLEILVGGGEHANIHGESLTRPDRLEALFLEHAQDFGLRAQAHVSDFVEEESAAVGLLEFSDLVFGRTGKTAFHVAKQFGFNQLFGNCGAADLDKQALASQTGGVQGASHKFLASSAFAVNQNPAVGGGRDGDLLAQGLHGHAVANNLIAMAKLDAQELIFFLQAALLDGVADQDDDFVERERLLDEIESAEFGGADGGFNGAVSGDHDYRGRPLRGLKSAEGLEAVHAGEPNVEEDDFHVAAGGALERFFGRAHGFDDVTFILQDGGKGFANAGFVVDDQKVRARGHQEASTSLRSAAGAGAGSATGSSIRKREPIGKLSSA